MKNIEIEVRIQLDKPDKFLQWLQKSAKLVEISKQRDFYFEPPEKKFIYVDPDNYKDADEWLRIRISDRGNEFCYKKWHRDEKTRKSLYAEEIETSLRDGEKVIEIFERLGFKQVSVIKKRRESWIYNDFRFDCDEVDGLGFFVEIEFKGEIDDPSKGREKIVELIRKIGLENWKIIKRGYPWMQWNLGKNYFEED